MPKRDDCLVATDTAQSVLKRGLARPSYMAFGFCSLPIGRFNGQWLEPATGLYALGAGRRAFIPSLMRLAQPDALAPFGAGGTHGYSYCAADPVNRLDPGGQSFTFLYKAARELLAAADNLTNAAVQATARQTSVLGSRFALATTADVISQVTEAELRVLVKSVSLRAPARSAMPAVTYLARHNTGLIQAYGTATVTGLESSARAGARFDNAFALGRFDAQVLGIQRPVKVYVDKQLASNTFRQWRAYRRAHFSSPAGPWRAHGMDEVLTL